MEIAGVIVLQAEERDGDGVACRDVAGSGEDDIRCDRARCYKCSGWNGAARTGALDGCAGDSKQGKQQRCGKQTNDQDIDLN